MSFTNLAEDAFLDLYVTNVDFPNVGDAAGLQNSAAPGSLHVSLHTATLLDTDTLQTSGEAAYGAYARQAVARSVAGWTVSAGVADNDALITFPEATSGSETETDVGIGFALAGAGELQLFNALVASLAVSAPVQPQFAIGALDITCD